MKYISFCGYFEEPDNVDELEKKYPETFREEFLGTNSHEEDCYKDINCGFREDLDYQHIANKDSLDVYLAVIDETTGHLVADCPAGGWVNDCFVILDTEGQPVKANEENPNPIEQVI